MPFLGVTGVLASLLIVLLDRAECASLAREQIAEDNTGSSFTTGPRVGPTTTENENEDEDETVCPKLGLRKVLQVLFDF